MRRRLGFLIAAGCMGSTVDALAEGDRRPETAIVLELFDVLDETGDGVVDRNELAAVVQLYAESRVRARFSQLDKNRDGRVERREVGKMSAARFSRFDVDRDGSFTVTELATVMRRECERRLDQVLSALDLDGDGRWTKVELHESGNESLALRSDEQRRRL